MFPIETKDFNNQIMGKDGFINTSYIQRHMPEKPLILLITDTNHSIFTQEDHPVLVLRDGEVVKIPANEVNITDKIWVSNLTIFNIDQSKIYLPDIDPKQMVCKFYNGTYKDTNLMKGTETNYRFVKEFIYFDRNWIKEFLKELTICNVYKSFMSYNFVCQLKIMCDLVGVDFKLYDVAEFDDLRFNVYIDVNREVDTRKLVGEYVNLYKIQNGIIWKDFVYDIKTESAEYMNGCIQNSNSFHSMLDKTLLYVEENGERKVRTFESIWNSNNNPIRINGDQEEKSCQNLKVWDKDTFTNVIQVIRHKKNPDTKMVMLRSANNDCIISQDNHPNMLALNLSICQECNIPYIKTKKQGYWECPGCKKHPHNVEHKSDENYLKVKPSEFVKSKYFSFNSFPIFENQSMKNIDPPIEPYLFGMFLGEGSYLYKHRRRKSGTDKTLYGFIITQGKSLIQDKIITECKNIPSRKMSVNGEKCRTAEQIILYDNEDKLSHKMIEITGRYSRERSMGENFIYYSDETLSKIMCGVIDAEGSYITENGRDFISFETTSFILAQQMHHILEKFNISHNISLASVKKLTRNQSYIIRMYPKIKDMDFFKHSVKVDGKIKTVGDNEQTTKYRYPGLVNYCKDIYYDDSTSLVYDLTTETGTLTMNGMWSSNTGGAATLSKVKIVDEIMANLSDSLRTSVDHMFVQVENDLQLKEMEAYIEIDKKIYNVDHKIEIDDKSYKLPLGYFDIKVGSLFIPVTIEQDITIFKTADVMDSEDKIIIKYKKDDLMFQAYPREKAAQKIAQELDGLVGGKSPFTTPESLFIKFYKTLEPIGSGYDSVHLEVIISNILRWKKDPHYPARLKYPYEFKTYSIKSLPSVISWPLGIAFENIGRSLASGMIADRMPSSPIEKILFGEPLSDLAEPIKPKKKKL